MNKLEVQSANTNWEHAQQNFRRYYNQNQRNLDAAKDAFVSFSENEF